MCPNNSSSPDSSSRSAEDSAENAVQAQLRLAVAVKKGAVQLADCLETVLAMQNGLMGAVQEYLGLNIAGFDESTLALVQGCSSLFEESFVAFGQYTGGLRSLAARCDEVTLECNRVTGLLQDRGQAMQELQHYDQKVVELRESGTSERLSRNRGKLDRARARAEAVDQNCKEELVAFQGRCTQHSKDTLHAFLDSYMLVLANWGRGAKALVSVRNEEKSEEAMAGMKDGSTLREHEDASEGESPLVQKLSSERMSTMEEDVAKVSADLVVKPSIASRSVGCDAIVRCQRLTSQISEVYIGGKQVEILEAGEVDEGRPAWARIRVPLSTTAGGRHVEVRTVDQDVATQDAGFTYYEPLAFGACGRDAQLKVPYGAQPGELPSVVVRKSGLVNGLALTAAPLAPISSQSAPQRYYFEVEVLRTSEKPRGTTRTVSIGFAWSDAAGFGYLPEQANQLRRALVAGGDLPRAHLDGSEVKKLSGWRPLVDVGEGAVLGAMLEVEAELLRLVIFQDGKQRCSVEVAHTLSWPGEPHGVVDVCGTVQQVALRQGSALPDMAC